MKERFEGLVEHLVSSGFFLEQAVEILERTMIERALARAKGNQSEASKALGIHRNTLQRKIAAYKLPGARVRRKSVAAETRTRARSRRRKAS